MHDSDQLREQFGTTRPTERTRVEYRQKCKASSFFLGKAVMGFADLTPDLHGAMATWSQGKSRRKLGLVSRDHLKTTVWTIARSVHRIINDPNIRICILNETASNAQNFLNRIEAVFERNAVFRWLFPELIPEKHARWSAEKMQVPRTMDFPEPTIEVFGVGGASTSHHYNCVAVGTPVWTSNGLVPIEDVRPCMRVLSITGHHVEVTHCETRDATEDLYSIAIRGQPEPLRVTGDHRVLVWTGRRGGRWIEAERLKRGDKLMLPIPRGDTRVVSRTNKRFDQLANNERIWKLLGYWVAEGGALKYDKYRVRLIFGSHEPHLAEECAAIVREELGVNCSISAPTPSSTLVVSFSDKDFKELTAKFGTHAHNKHIPPMALTAARSFRAAFVKAYFVGDGHLSGKYWKASSVSRSLASGIQLLLATLDIPATVRAGTRAGRRLVVGNLCNTRDVWVMNAYGPMMALLMGSKPWFPDQREKVRVVDNYLLQPIKSISRIPPCKVVDLTVRRDESFVAQGVCVHNCVHEDDLVGKEASESPAVMRKAIDQHKLAESLLSDPIRDEIVTIGTRWAPFDLVDWMVKHEKNLDCFYLQCVHPGDHPRAGQPVWPERFTLEYFADLRIKLGPGMFNLQYMNVALAEGVTDLDPAWRRTWNWTQKSVLKDGVWRKEDAILLERPLSEGGPLVYAVSELWTFQVIDPCHSPESGDARAAVITFGLTPDDPFNIVILSAIAKKMTPNRTIDAAWEDCQRFNVITTGVEVVGAQRTYFYWIPTVYPNMPIYRLKSETSLNAKQRRIRTVCPSFGQQGRIYSHPSQFDFHEEWDSFPSGKTVDLLDALSYGPQLWAAPEPGDEAPRHPNDDDDDDVRISLDGRSRLTGY